MAEITQKRRGELVRGVFEILLPEKEGLPAKEVLAKLEHLVPPTEFENSFYKNRPDQRRFEKIVRFSSIPAVKAGWLLKQKGIWNLTDEGRRAFTEYRAPEDSARIAEGLYSQWRSERPSPADDKSSADTPVAAATLEEAEEAAWSQIEQHMLSLSPFDFQDLFAGLLRAMGYHVSWVSPPGPDGGIDVVTYADPLGVRTPRIKVQVKRRTDKVTVGALRSFLALLSDTDVGLFVSTGGFTKEAVAEARKQEKRRITLLDLERLFDLWVEHYERVPEEKRRLLPLRPIYYLSQEE
jgi:restriction system protein